MVDLTCLISRIGMVGYMWAKKKSMHCSLTSAVKSPGVLGSFGEVGGLWEFREIWAGCFWVSLNSEMTLALLPFGPFF